jgi:predicted branched-subunit amino acid permease
MVGTFIGIAALAHGYGFSLLWLLVTTALMWAGPAQVILITATGQGAAWFETALAVLLSGVRLLPMVVSLMPMIRQTKTRALSLLPAAHFTAISMWVEALRLLPALPREHRLAFTTGLGAGFLGPAFLGSVVGYYLVSSLPNALTAGLLFISPMSFLVSTARNARMMIDRLALAIGLAIAPVLAYEQVQLDLLWSGVIAGTAAYAAHRFREARR